MILEAEMKLTNEEILFLEKKARELR